MITQDDTAPLAERDEAATKIIGKAEDGDLYAQYLVGKLYQDGPVLIPDSVESLYWFDLAARQGHTVAQYEAGKILLSHDPEATAQPIGSVRNISGVRSLQRIALRR